MTIWRHHSCLGVVAVSTLKGQMRCQIFSLVFKRCMFARIFERADSTRRKRRNQSTIRLDRQKRSASKNRNYNCKYESRRNGDYDKRRSREKSKQLKLVYLIQQSWNLGSGSFFTSQKSNSSTGDDAPFSDDDINDWHWRRCFSASN